MSVNLHLLLKVGGYQPSRAIEVKQAIQAVLVSEQISRDLSPLAESGEGASRAISARSNPEFPVIVSSSYQWLPKVKELLAKATEEANGGPCAVVFEGWDADEADSSDAASDYLQSVKVRALKPNAELAAIIGAGPIVETDVVSKLWDYVKAHKLQNPQNRRMILCDAKLAAVMGKPEVGMAELMELARKHLS